jgi:c-di-GMP-binding flagellar brake protein YcgR
MFFSMEEGPIAVFTDDRNRTFTAVIMDLSPGGLGLSIKKGETTITDGDSLILSEVRGRSGLESIKNLNTEVKWVQNFKAFKHILFGCEFTDITEAHQEDIQTAINLWVL